MKIELTPEQIDSIPCKCKEPAPDVPEWPQERDDYFVVNGTGDIFEYTWNNMNVDKAYLKQNNLPHQGRERL